MTKFIVVIPDARAEQTFAMRNLFPPTRAAWWHWSHDVWLLSIFDVSVTIQTLANELGQLLPGTNFLLFEVPVGTKWTGWGPQNWQEWFSKYWP